MEEKKSSKRSRKKTGVNRFVVMSFIAVFGLCFVLIYLMFAQIFYARFLPNTYISGINVSFKTVKDVEKLIDEKVANYKLVIKSKDSEDTIYGKNIGLTRVYGTTVEEFLSSQRPIAWIKNLFSASVLESPLPLTISEYDFNKQLEDKAFIKKSVQTASQKTIISEYEPNKGYKIIDSKEGEFVDKDLAVSYIRSAILKLSDVVDISKDPENAYVSVGSENDYDKIKACVDLLNKYTGTYIEYKDNFIIDGNHISNWIIIDESYNISFDDVKIGEFVDSLARSYLTDESINFKTSYGSYVNINGSDYSKIVDKEAEVSKIKELVEAGYSGKREPEFNREFTESNSNKYGDTYVEVNLSSQHLFYYKKGELVLESDIISGDESKGTPTPAGIYRVVEKLGGTEYIGDVVKFSDNLSFYSRADMDRFGGSIYKTNGSEGGIIVPKEKIKSLYDNIDNNTMVLCYHLDGKNQTVVESSAESEEIAQSEAQTTAADTAEPKPKKNQKTRKKSNPKPAQPSQAPAPTTAAPVESSTAAVINIPETTKAAPKRNEPIRAFRTGPGVETTADPNEVGPGVPKIRPESE